MGHFDWGNRLDYGQLFWCGRGTNAVQPWWTTSAIHRDTYEYRADIDGDKEIPPVKKMIPGFHPGPFASLLCRARNFQWGAAGPLPAAELAQF